MITRILNDLSRLPPRRQRPADTGILAVPAALALLLVCGSAAADLNNFQVPLKLRQTMRNTTSPGSCVQFSLQGCGHAVSHRGAQTLPWRSEFGPPIHGGSGPSRVRRYAVQRDIPIWNVTGSATYDWCLWAVRNHRVAGLGFGSNHFQLLVGADRRGWTVLDNNPPGPKTTQYYNDRQFRKMHAASGHWVVIIARPPPPQSPNYSNQWWKE